MNKVREFVNQNIMKFHEARLERLKSIDLFSVLSRKNPYLFKAKNINYPEELVRDILNAYLSSSEEKLFGDFLEELAIFIAKEAYDGRKSSAQGLDLEFERDGVHYIVSIKSGTNWGNSSQIRKLEDDFKQARTVLKQSNHVVNVQPVLGICYGSVRTNDSYRNMMLKLVGQNFWYFISGNKNLYMDIILPLGYKANEFNEKFKRKKQQIINEFTEDLARRFCDEDGLIDWKEIVEFNSGNLDINIE